MATITWRGKNNTTARLDWYENGERRRISIGQVAPEQAETLRLEKELQLRTGTGYQLTAPGFKLFAKDYLKWHKYEYPASHNRIDQITTDYLIPHLAETPLDEITPLQLETYKQDRRAKAKTETINKELRTLNAILNKAIEWQAIYANPINKLPTLKVTDSKPPRYYTKDELDKIYAAAPYNWYVWRFLANTGLRRAELLNLEWADIQDNTIHVISTETNRTKSGKWRPVPLSDGAQYALARMGKHFGQQKKTGRIYTSTASSLSRAFSRVLARTEIVTPRGSLHSLRHSFCSHLVMSGVDLTTVQRLAGHSTNRVTEQYAHLAPSHLKLSTDKLGL